MPRRRSILIVSKRLNVASTNGETYDFNIAKKLFPEIITGLKQKIEGFMNDSIKEVAALLIYRGLKNSPGKVTDRCSTKCGAFSNLQGPFLSVQTPPPDDRGLFWSDLLNL